MGIFYIDKVKTLVDNTLLQFFAFAVADENNPAPFFLPRLPQSDATHDVACTDVGGGIGTNV